MRLHFIRRDNINALFLPDTLEYFKLNHDTMDIMEDIYNGLTKDEIITKHNLIEKDYQQVQSFIDNIGGLDIPDFPVPADVLGKLVIHITNTCNLSCKYCYAHGGNYHSPESIISDEVLYKTLDVFFRKYKKIKGIQLFGGEPALNIPAIKKVCEYLENKKLNEPDFFMPEIGLITNGTIVTNEFIDLINKYHLYISISLDGPKIVNDRLRIFNNGSGTSDTIVANIHQLKENISTFNSIESTYTQYHVDEGITIPKLIKYIKDEFGIEQIHIVPVVSHEDTDYKLQSLSPFHSHVSEILKQHIEDGYPINTLTDRIIQFLKHKHVVKYVCEAALHTLSVSVKGDVYPCFMFNDEKCMHMGNVYDPDVFESNQFYELYNKFKDFNKFQNPTCKDCFSNTLCSGCLGHDYIVTGNIHDLDEVNCNMTRLLTEEVILELVRRSQE